MQTDRGYAEGVSRSSIESPHCRCSHCHCSLWTQSTLTSCTIETWFWYDGLLLSVPLQVTMRLRAGVRAVTPRPWHTLAWTSRNCYSSLWASRSTPAKPCAVSPDIQTFEHAFNVQFVCIHIRYSWQDKGKKTGRAWRVFNLGFFSAKVQVSLIAVVTTYYLHKNEKNIFVLLLFQQT